MEMKDRTLEKDKKKGILRELFDSERTYVGQLNHLVQDHYEPLTVLYEVKGSGMFASYLDQAQLDLLYGHFPKLYALHKDFMDDLEEALHNYERIGGNLATMFEKLIPKLVVYLDYCDSISVCTETYTYLLANRKDFAKFVKEEKQNQKQYQVDYDAFIKNPVGRLNEYVTFLKALHKHTDSEEGKEERDHLKKCGTAIRDLEYHIGATARDAEEGKRMAEAAIKLQGGEVHKPFRTVKREGFLTKVSRKAVQKRYFILFNDLLMWGAAGTLSKTAFKFKGQTDIATAWIQNLEDSKHLKNGFQIVTKEKTYTIAAESPAEKKAWIQDINACIRVFINQDPSLAEQRGQVEAHKGTGVFKMFTLKGKEVVATNKDHTLATPTPQKQAARKVETKKAPGEGDADTVNRDYLRLMGAMVITAEENRANAAQGPSRGGVVRAGAYGEAERRGKEGVDFSTGEAQPMPANSGATLKPPVRASRGNSVSERAESKICRATGCANPRLGGYYCKSHADQFS